MRVPLIGLAMLVACGGGGGSTPKSDGGATDGGVPRCPDSDAGIAGVGADEFGPNAAAVKPPAAVARQNIYEATAFRTLVGVEIYLRPDLPQTRVTIAVHEALSRTAPFKKVADVQLEVPACEGWVASGPLAVPLVPGRFYSVGFDPNQALTPFAVTESNSVPIDGALGRLIGSRTGTSVSLPELGWDKVSDRDYNRQRLTSVPRPADAPDAAATFDGAVDAAVVDAAARF